MSVHQSKPELNLETFQALHHMYHDRLRAGLTGFVRNTDEAEDIAAAAFETAWAKRAGFRGQASPQTWLYAIALNEARNRIGNKKTRYVPFDGIVADRLSEPDRTGEALANSELHERLSRALAKIPAKYRTVLINHFIDGHSVRQIAQRQGIPVGTVLSRVFTAKRLLREAWEAAT